MAHVRTMTLGEADEAYRRAWEGDQRESALAVLRGTLPNLERRVEAHRATIASLERRLSDLHERRAKFAEELAGLPDDATLAGLPGWEEDEVRRRRQDLEAAIGALDGEDPRGTLVDDLWNQPRIPVTQRRLAEEREQLASAEGGLVNARRQLGD